MSNEDEFFDAVTGGCAHVFAGIFFKGLLGEKDAVWILAAVGIRIKNKDFMNFSDEAPAKGHHLLFFLLNGLS